MTDLPFHSRSRRLGFGKNLRRIADFLLPHQCFGCGAPVLEKGAICASCWSRIDFIEKPFCDITGIPFPYDAGEGAISGWAVAAPPKYNRARAVARFDKMARRLVHALKYNDRLECAPLMGSWMARAGDELLRDADIIAPVPLYRGRLWTRRFNQSALLASEIGKTGGVAICRDLLKRTRHTKAQVGLSASERRRNVAGAFGVTAKYAPEIEGKTILLVDDVITTGATAEACTRALLRGGASGVDVLAFARVVDPSRLNI